MNKIRDFFLTEGTPRWQLLLGGFFVALLSFLQSEYSHRRTQSVSDATQYQARVEAKVIEIQQHSIDFQTFANSYVSAVLDGSVEISERRDTLIANILAQDAALDVSRNIFDSSLSEEIANYRASLREMKSAVEQVSGVLSMNVFWAAASDLLVARNVLLDAMEQHRIHSGV